MQIDFLPELQIPWSIKEISFRNLSEINIHLVEYTQEGSPDILGRHYTDILTWPDIMNEKRSLQLIFTQCVYFNLRDEFAPALSENCVGEGRQLQRLLNSELVAQHRDRSIEKIVHYRICGVDEVVDIVCRGAPSIIKKNFT